MRIDHDMLGSMEIPDHIYHGVQTERARHNGAVSRARLGDFPSLIAALAKIKKAAALANADIGGLRKPVAAAIAAAADEVIGGRFAPYQFPVDLLGGGGGTSLNMNINEVIANRANELLLGRKGYEFVHPNNHVNMGQSTTDVISTAISLTLYTELRKLIEAMELLESSLRNKIAEYGDVVKLSRTCLQDAVPITFAQEFSAYHAVARRAIDRLGAAAQECLQLPMGGTVVGTGLGVGTGYAERIFPRLREVTGLPVYKTENFFDCIQNGDVFLDVSTTFKAIATNLAKMSKDLRLLCSGPRAGLMEISLPAVQAGSTLIPGKVNPVIPEMMVQICMQVLGNDCAVTLAVESSELDYNTWSGVIIKNLLESCALLASGIPLLVGRCIDGLEVNVDQCRTTAENSLALSTVVAAVYGYEAGARAARHAVRHGTTIKRAALELGIVPEQDAEELFDPLLLTDPHRSSHLLERKAAEHRAASAAFCARLPKDTRKAVFAAAAAVAQADGAVTGEEAQALEVITEILDVDLSVADAARLLSGGADLGSLSAHGGEISYACAMWIATAASGMGPEETRVLTTLRERFDVGAQTAEFIAGHIAEMAAERAQYMAAHEEMPWWENFAALMTWIVASWTQHPAASSAAAV